MTNIAICGRMASGKTTMAQWLEQHGNYEVQSLAGAVKRIGTDFFGMTQKDRPLLQQIGMKMREIRPTVWIDYLVRQADELNQSMYDVVVDDVRFVNEAKRFKSEGWILVKMDIGEDLQLERLQRTYPDTWETHMAHRNDLSEQEVDEIPEDWFDIIISAETDTGDYTPIIEFIEGQLSV